MPVTGVGGAGLRELHLGRREPLFEAGAGELRARVGQRAALRIGRGVRVAGLAALADLARVTSAGEERGGRVGETLLLRTGDFGDPAILDLPLLGRVGEAFGDDAGGH